MSKRVRSVNRDLVNKKLQEAHNYRKVVPAFREALKSFQGMDTLEEIDEHLKSNTGFVNVELSATAMGLEAEYKLVSQYLGKINLNNYGANGLVSDEFKKKCELEFTSYYSDEDVKLFDKIEKALDKINELGLPNGAIYSNHRGVLKFNERHYNVARQLNKSSRSIADKQAKAKQVIDAVKGGKSIVERVE
jgi:hypothetical protein